MADLIETLKDEHRAIQSLLRQVREAGVTTAEGQAKLRKARELLVSHLQKEDHHLYPAMQRSQEADTANEFAAEMQSVSQQILAFFDQYENGGDSFQFALDFGRVLGLINNRIRREEVSLYRRYEQVVAAPV